VVVARVGADVVGQRDQVGHVAVVEEPQHARGREGARVEGVDGDRPLDPVEGLVQASGPGQDLREVGVQGQVARVVAQRAPPRVDRVVHPASGAVGVPEPHLGEQPGLAPRGLRGPLGRLVDALEPPRDRRRRAEEQRRVRVGRDRAPDQAQVRLQRRAQFRVDGLGNGPGQPHEPLGEFVGVPAAREVVVLQPRHRRPRRARHREGRRDQQVERDGRLPRGDEVGVRHGGAHVHVTGDREQVEHRVAGVRGELGERLVGLGQRRGAAQRVRDVPGGVPQVSAVQGEPRHCQFALGGQPRIVFAVLHAPVHSLVPVPGGSGWSR
jgi:hypothetical protein